MRFAVTDGQGRTVDFTNTVLSSTHIGSARFWIWSLGVSVPPMRDGEAVNEAPARFNRSAGVPQPPGMKSIIFPPAVRAR